MLDMKKVEETGVEINTTISAKCSMCTYQALCKFAEAKMLIEDEIEKKDFSESPITLRLDCSMFVKEQVIGLKPRGVTA